MATTLSTEGQSSQASRAARRQSAQASAASSAGKELGLLLSLFLIALISNFAVEGQRMVLALYTLPTLFSAYKYGRRHAVMTALASALLVVLVVYFHPAVMTPFMHLRPFVIPQEKWFDVALWSGILLVIAYAMGTLYERMQGHMLELRDSYKGILLILQHIAANDKYSQTHSYRVSVCATKIAERMDLSSEQVEDIRAAALLQDVDKLGISREILYKAANFTADDFRRFQRDLAQGKATLPAGAGLRRAIPILLVYSASKEGKASRYQDTPLEARILAVADAYETLISGKRGMPPSIAIGNIAERAGVEFDSSVVEAFAGAFQHGRSQQGKLPTLVTKS